MHRVKKWWWGLPLVAVAALAVTLAMQGRIGVFWPFGAADRQARVPDAPEPGMARGPAEAAPETFAFKAARDGARIVLSGSLAPGDTRNALLEAIKQALPTAVVSDELKVSETAPRLGEAALFSLQQLARLPSGAVTVGADRIAIVGQAPDVEAYNAIAGAVQSLPEGFRLDIAGLIPPVVAPYTWSATSSEGEVVLTGHVPSEAVRGALVATAREAFPDKQVAERLQPASGLPPGVDFEAAARFALAQLAELRSGTAELVDATLNLRGDATDRETLASVRAALQTGLPPGLRAGSVAIALSRPSPYTFRARREAGVLTLTGYYPDRETRTAIHELIRGRFFSEQIVDRMRAAEGAPPNFLAGVSFGLEHLSRLASGEVAASGTALRLNGESLYEQTAEQMGRAVSAMSVRGWTGRAEVRVRPSEKADAAALRSPQP